MTSSQFYLQDPDPAGNTPFKQAITVYTGMKPAVAAGDSVSVAGTVIEYYPGQSDTPSALPVAEIDDPVITEISAGNPLPAPQVAKPAAPAQLSVATYNLDNLSPRSGAARFASLGRQITVSPGAPDILGVQEIQDSDGSADDGVVAADVTLGDLTAASTAAGGPAYSWTEIDPVNDQDGGQPGGNIRQVILYRTDTGLTFDAAPGGSATAADPVTRSGTSAALAQSPGRIDPSDPAWSGAETLTDPGGSGRTMPGAQSRWPRSSRIRATRSS